MAQLELNPDVSFERLQEQKNNEFLVTEEELMEGVKGSGVSCTPREDSNRFWDCTIGTSNPQLNARKTVLAPIDAVNVKTEDTETETRATRVSKTSVNTVERTGSVEISGICRASSSTNRGTFCELTVEDE